ncbi:uncharacterized protein SCHCODRAFT_02493737 [Schizophyllum commune H4-8]|uniref:Uncharacterized protein n=1 Tax=Schizophyllum commune (strain H4-8 / FGSC 9210) TaxID=578458 RepID=D8PYZ3_SCHCM|nr:uncharacterized protein SCHCODRAFT_02493737 [Schizophyllum commune H4-8]KAI5896165.1 hypothetical protein SCHCODRAFT_02493737 [Schizophyllum commune H4-8]
MPYPFPTRSPFPWNKASLPKILARDRDGALLADDVINEAMMANPVIPNFNVTQRDRWARLGFAPLSPSVGDLQQAFALEDPNGSALGSLLDATMFMFGAPGHVKRWVENLLLLITLVSRHP